MFQRGSTYIMSTKNGWEVIFKGMHTFRLSYNVCVLTSHLDAYAEGAPPVEDVDRFNASFPHYMSVRLAKRRVDIVAEMDKWVLRPFA